MSAVESERTLGFACVRDDAQVERAAKKFRGAEIWIGRNPLKSLKIEKEIFGNPCRLAAIVWKGWAKSLEPRATGRGETLLPPDRGGGTEAMKFREGIYAV